MSTIAHDGSSQLASSETKTGKQIASEAEVDTFRSHLGPFVVAAETTRMPMVFTDARAADHPIIFANASFLKLTGYGRAEVLGVAFCALLSLGNDAEARAEIEFEFAGPSGAEPEIYFRRNDGAEVWASLFVSPVRDEAGAVVQHFVSLVDLTRLKQESARRKAMIDELNHRVKNTLSTVQSIVTQVFRRPGTTTEMVEAIESRILALSRSHDLLTNSHWFGTGLHDLVDTALEPFGAAAGRVERFTVHGDNVQLSPATTLSLAIALHELATNAVKYGAFSTDAGTIAIDWGLRKDQDAGDRLVIRWTEQGGPPVASPKYRGFGSWVIEQGLAHELDGRVALDFHPHGLACTIDIPEPEEIA